MHASVCTPSALVAVSYGHTLERLDQLPSTTTIGRGELEQQRKRESEVEGTLARLQAEEEASTMTYKVVKPGSGTWKTWETVTEKVGAGVSREEMLRKRQSEKSDRHCR